MWEVLYLEYNDKMFKEKMRLRNKADRDMLKGYGNFGLDLDDMFCDVIIE